MLVANLASSSSLKKKSLVIANGPPVRREAPEIAGWLPLAGTPFPIPVVNAILKDRIGIKTPVVLLVSSVTVIRGLPVKAAMAAWMVLAEALYAKGAVV